jgi:hypothetical protein
MATQVRASRPFGLRLVYLETFIIAGRGWGRVWFVIDRIEDYRRLHHAPPPAIYIAINLCWGVIFSALLLALWWRQRQTPRVLWVALMVYGIVELGWWRLFTQSAYDRTRFPFWMVCMMAVLGGNYWIIQREKFRSAFGRNILVKENSGDSRS